MRNDVLGVGIDAVTQDEAVEKIAAFVREGGAHHVVTANPEILDNATRTPGLREQINKASLVTADGQGVLLAGRILGRSFPERVTGIDLAEKLCEESGKRNLKLYLLGAEPGVADEAAARMRRLYPDVQIVGTHHGYFLKQGPAEVVEDLKRTQPDVLLVGMGSPYQEDFIANHLAECAIPVGIGVGGSFDVMSGRVKRAPDIFIRLKLEWLYRILGDPKRFKRALALPRFVLKVVAQAVQEKRG